MGLAPEAILADLFDIFLRHDPGGAGGHGRVEQEIGPRLVQDEPDA